MLAKCLGDAEVNDFEEIQRTIREEEPPKPSTKLSGLKDEASDIARSRSTEVSTLVKSLHKELEWIPLKAMRKERERRYKTAADLAEDIGNYLFGNPLTAGPESKVYRAKKFIKRNRTLVISAAAILVVLLSGIIVSSVFAFRESKARALSDRNRVIAEQAGISAEAAREEEKRQRQIAEQEQIKASEAQKEAEKQTNIAKQEKIRTEEKVLELQQQMYANKIAAAQKAFEDAAVNETVEVLLSCSEELRHWEWYYLWKVSTTSRIWTYGSAKVVKEGLVQADWRLPPLGIYEDSTFLGDALKKFNINAWVGKQVKFSSNSKYLFIMNPEGSMSSRDFTGKVESAIKIWDIESGKEIKQIKIPDSTIRSFCVEPNGARIAILTNKEVIITDSNGTVLKRQNAHGKSSYHESKEIAWSPDGKYIAFELRIARDTAGVVGIWDVEQDEIVHTIPLKEKTGKYRAFERSSLSGQEYDIYSLVFSPDSKSLVAGTNFSRTSNRTLRVWDVQTGKELMVFGDQEFVIGDLSFSPDGKYLALASGRDWDSENFEVRILDFAEKTVKHSLKGHSGVVTSVSYSPDGRRIVTTSEDGTVRIWNADTGTELFRLGSLKRGFFLTSQARFSPDGRSLAIWEGGLGGRGNKVKILTAASKEDVEKWQEDQIKNVQQKKEAEILETDEFLKAIQTGDVETLNDFLVQEKYRREYISYPLSKVISQGGHAKTVKLFIERGADVNEAGLGISRTVLHEAIERNALDIVKVLIENGADIEAKNSNKYTPLHMAAKQGQTEIVEYLIENGANLDAVKHIDTALTMALEKGHFDIAELLINKGAEVNIWQARALKLAKGQKEIEGLLVEKGAVENQILRSFQDAIKSGNTENVNNILQKHPRLVYWIDYPDQTPIFTAVIEGNAKMVGLLISKGAKINLFDSYNKALIYYAVSQKEIMGILLNSGIDINASITDDGETLLHVAIEKNNCEIILYLLSEGSKVNCTNNYRETPLHLAAKVNNKDIVDILLKSGADINAQTRSGDTPLHLVVKKNNKEVVLYLLSEGADVSIPNKSARTLIDIANDEMKRINSVHTKMKELKAILESQEELSNTTKPIIKSTNRDESLSISNLVNAVASNSLENVILIIEKGGDINAKTTEKYARYKNRIGCTALHLAVLEGNKEIVMYLLSKEADANLTDASGLRPSDYAKNAMDNARLEHEKMEQLMTILEAQVGLQASDLLDAVKAEELDKIREILTTSQDLAYARPGRAPNCAFIEAIKKNKIQIVKLFIQAGVDVNHRALGGDPALEIALRYKIDPEIAKLLIENGADVNIRDQYGEKSMLHKAIQKRNSEIVKIMIEKGADTNAIVWYSGHESFSTPLDMALEYLGDREVFQLFLEKGADITGDKGIRYLEKAVENGNSEAVYVLLENGVDIEGEKGRALFQKAFQKKFFSNRKIIEYLITHDADFKGIKNSSGQNVLLYALSTPSPGKMYPRLGDGNIFNIRTVETRSINIEFVKDLIRKKADVNIKDKYNGNSPLHYALRSEDKELIKILLENGADVNTQDKNGNTLFHSAV